MQGKSFSHVWQRTIYVALSESSEVENMLYVPFHRMSNKVLPYILIHHKFHFSTTNSCMSPSSTIFKSTQLPPTRTNAHHILAITALQLSNSPKLYTPSRGLESNPCNGPNHDRQVGSLHPLHPTCPLSIPRLINLCGHGLLYWSNVAILSCPLLH